MGISSDAHGASPQIALLILITCQRRGSAWTAPGSSYTLGIGGARLVLKIAHILSLSTVVNSFQHPHHHLDSASTTWSFSIASGDTMCIPRHIYSHPEVEHCVVSKTWRDVTRDRDLFATSGLDRNLHAK